MNPFLQALLTSKLSLTSTLEKRMKAVPEKVKRYHEIEKSDLLKEYETLTQFLQGEVYLTNQKKAARLRELANSKQVKAYIKLLANKNLQAYLNWAADEANYAQLANEEAVKASKELKQMKKMDASSDLRDWKGIINSNDVKEYLALKDEVQDYSKEEARQKELCKHEDITFYQNMDLHQVNRYDHAEKIMDENFDLTQIDKSGWKPGFAYPNGFKQVHSYVNEVQSYTGGKNVEIKDSVLYIHTRKEKNEAPAWDSKKGLVMHPFQYSSDIIYNTQAFEEGTVIQVKCRCRGLVNHGIYLRSEKHAPFISVFNYTDRAVFCGLKPSLGVDDYTHKIEGLQPIPFSIYTLVWGKDEIVWYLNDMEVHRTKNILPKGEKMYLHLYSFQFEGKRCTEGTLEVDWIHAYKMDL